MYDHQQLVFYRMAAASEPVLVLWDWNEWQAYA